MRPESLAVLLLVPLLASAQPVSRGETYERLAAQADLVLRGQVVQADLALVTVVIDGQLQGIEPAGALTFEGGGEGWQIGERSLFFLARLEPNSGRARFRSVARRDESLLASASAAGMKNAPSVPLAPLTAGYSRPHQEPPFALSLPGLAAGLLVAAGIVVVAVRRSRAHPG